MSIYATDVSTIFLAAPLYAQVIIHHTHFTFPSFFLLRSSRDPSPSHLNFSTHSPFLACRTCLGCYIRNRGSSLVSHLLLRSCAHLSFPSSRDQSLVSVSCPCKDVFMCIWMICSYVCR